MPNAISFAASLSVSGSGISFSLTQNKSATQVGTDITAQTQAIGFAAAELLDISADIGTAGYIMVHNQDATNFVELALADFTSKFAKLRPGEFCVLPASTFTIYAKADTGSCTVAVLAIEL